MAGPGGTVHGLGWPGTRRWDTAYSLFHWRRPSSRLEGRARAGVSRSALFGYAALGGSCPDIPSGVPWGRLWVMSALAGVGDRVRGQKDRQAPTSPYAVASRATGT